MSQQAFFLARAAEARRDAEAATLDNARERFRTSELAWTAMAARAGRADRERQKILEAKARRDEERAAAAAALATQPAG